MNPVDRGRLRWQAVGRVARDKSLSAGAVRVYAVLNDLGRSAGVTLPLTESQIAEESASSERSVRAWIQELEARGYIQRRRVARGFEYTVQWANLAAVSASVDSANAAGSSKSIRQMTAHNTANAAGSHLQDTPSLTSGHRKERKGGRVTEVLPEKRPPARSSPRIEELAEGLRTLGYQPDRPLVERLARSIPPECSIEAALAVLRRRVSRLRSKALTQPMLPVFFEEDVPVQWREEAAILESHNAERARLAEVDRQQAAADRIEAQGILERGETDPIERDWAVAILEMQGVGWAATA